jgi:hypothetical protein
MILKQTIYFVTYNANIFYLPANNELEERRSLRCCCSVRRNEDGEWTEADPIKNINASQIKKEAEAPFFKNINKND